MTKIIVTATQTNAFFNKLVQMDLPANICLAIAQEGLEDLDDLVKFDEKSLKQINENLNLRRTCTRS